MTFVNNKIEPTSRNERLFFLHRMQLHLSLIWQQIQWQSTEYLSKPTWLIPNTRSPIIIFWLEFSTVKNNLVVRGHSWSHSNEGLLKFSPFYLSNNNMLETATMRVCVEAYFFNGHLIVTKQRLPYYTSVKSTTTSEFE